MKREIINDSQIEENEIVETESAVVEEPIEEPIRMTGIVDTDKLLNVRKGPGTEHDVLFTLNKNDEVDIAGTETDSKSNDWYAINTTTGSGYAMAKYIKMV